MWCSPVPGRVRRDGWLLCCAEVALEATFLSLAKTILDVCVPKSSCIFHISLKELTKSCRLVQIKDMIHLVGLLFALHRDTPQI